MDQLLEVQMLNALEFFHYSYRFQNQLFVISLEDGISLKDLLNDLRVLNAARINAILVTWNSDNLKTDLEAWNARGFKFDYIEFDFESTLSQDQCTQIVESFGDGRIPVVAVKKEIGKKPSWDLMDQATVKLSTHFVVEKVFFMSKESGLVADEEFISHLTVEEAQRRLAESKQINLGHERFRGFIEANLKYGFEIVLLEGVSGSLFQEVFTHRGRGTFLTNDYPNVIRKGELTDVSDIQMLMKPYMRSGSILSVSEDSIATDVEEYYVYTVNNSVVALSKLTDHGDAVELAKFCTLPRYQGKGRAKELALMMIETAKKAGKSNIFALTVETKMEEFFESLGFRKIKRAELPETWKENYNMERPSKAFQLSIKKG